ncbi:MAG: hypothetical protein HFI72_07380 [Peptococcaceae bacterium]|nr:hypothetical protein [Peptococcaceae bacterium]
MNKANFPNFYKDMGELETKGLLDSWYLQFQNYDKNIIQAAFMEALKVCRFPVTIADIFERLGKIGALHQVPVDSLWQQFLHAAEDAYLLSYGFGYTAPGRTEGKTQGQENREKAERIFAALEPEIQQYVGTLERLVDFGKMDKDKLEQIIQPAFRRSIDSMRERHGLEKMLNQETKELLLSDAVVDKPLLEDCSNER